MTEQEEEADQTKRGVLAPILTSWMQPNVPAPPVLVPPAGIWSRYVQTYEEFHPLTGIIQALGSFILHLKHVLFDLPLEYSSSIWIPRNIRNILHILDSLGD